MTGRPTTSAVSMVQSPGHLQVPPHFIVIYVTKDKLFNYGQYFSTKHGIIART